MLAHVDWLGFRSSFDFKHVETHSLGERTALTNGDNITFLHTEARREMGSNVLVTLLETLVLTHVVQVITTHNDRALHLVGKNHTLQDTATDSNVTGERAFLVDITTVNGSLWGLEAKTNVLVETWAFLLTSKFLASKKDTFLLLECFFGLLERRNIMNMLVQSTLQRYPF